MSASNEVTIYLMAREDVERLLTAKYGAKLAAVKQACLDKQNERRARWLKKA